MSAEYPLAKRGELWRLQTPISAANRVVLIISDTDFDRHRNQVLTCDVISTDPGGPPLTVRLDESDPVTGWVCSGRRSPAHSRATWPSDSVTSTPTP